MQTIAPPHSQRAIPLRAYFAPFWFALRGCGPRVVKRSCTSNQVASSTMRHSGISMVISSCGSAFTRTTPVAWRSFLIRPWMQVPR
ncbi:MAG: hypothetical protein WKG01_11475 [Kofleriaceae bacterium]